MTDRASLFDRTQCPTAGRTPGQHQRRVGIPDVQPGSLVRLSRGGFAESRVVLGDRAVFGSSSPRNPPTIRKTQLDCGVERGAIDSGLAAGPDLNGAVHSVVVPGKAAGAGRPAPAVAVPPPLNRQNVTVTVLEQVLVPARHTW